MNIHTNNEHSIPDIRARTRTFINFDKKWDGKPRRSCECIGWNGSVIAFGRKQHLTFGGEVTADCDMAVTSLTVDGWATKGKKKSPKNQNRKSRTELKSGLWRVRRVRSGLEAGLKQIWIEYETFEVVWKSIQCGLKVNWKWTGSGFEAD